MNILKWKKITTNKETKQLILLWITCSISPSTLNDDYNETNISLYIFGGLLKNTQCVVICSI